MKPDRKLIEKFLKNRCTADEAEAVEAYFRKHPDQLDRWIPLNDWLGEQNMQLDKTVTERILQRIRNGYDNPAKSNRINRFLRYAVAASFIGVITLTGIMFRKEGTDKIKQKSSTAATITTKTEKPETVENNTGRLMQLTLSDNSLVTLYPNTSLTCLSQFENNKRELYLTGKAKFQVSKDPSRPFTVYAAGISTTALGTEFLISVKKNKQVSVSLIEGSVRVGSQHKSDQNQFVVLKAGDKLFVSSGQFLHYTLSHSEAVEKSAPPAALTAGEEKQLTEENKLIFKNEQLKDVLKRVEEKFAVTINYEQAPGIEEKLFTGTFIETDDLDFIIKTISRLHGIKYNIEDKEVVLSTE